MVVDLRRVRLNSHRWAVAVLDSATGKVAEIRSPDKKLGEQQPNESLAAMTELLD
mgnify:CR=1 FL=1